MRTEVAIPTLRSMTESNSYTDEQMLAIGAVAKRLGVSVATVRNWERAGRLRAIRTPGNQRRFLATDVEAIRSGVAA